MERVYAVSSQQLVCTANNLNSMSMTQIAGIPGDRVLVSGSEVNTVIGPGVSADGNTSEFVRNNIGQLVVKENKNHTSRLVYIDSRDSRFIPRVNDSVIGIIINVVGDFYRVLLQGFSSPALLSMMAFPNATKKNRPNLKLGQAVYARVSEVEDEIDVQLECLDPNTGKAGDFGPLDEAGYIFDLDLHFSRELLFNKDPVCLKALGQKCKYEIAIGVNGKIWLKCGDGLTTKPSDQTDELASMKTIRNTIAAAKFLSYCQRNPLSEIDRILELCFRK